MYTHTYTYIYIYVYMHIHLSLSLYTYIYIYMYTRRRVGAIIFPAPGYLVAKALTARAVRNEGKHNMSA